jgi:hypothetical protein
MHLSEYLSSTRVDLKKVTDGKSTLYKDELKDERVDRILVDNE